MATDIDEWVIPSTCHERAMEEKIPKFCHVAAEQSKQLMAGIPRSFTLAAEKRGEGIPKLKALLDQAK